MTDYAVLTNREVRKRLADLEAAWSRVTVRTMWACDTCGNGRDSWGCRACLRAECERRGISIKEQP